MDSIINRNNKNIPHPLNTSKLVMPSSFFKDQNMDKSSKLVIKHGEKKYQARLNFAQKLYNILESPLHIDIIKWLPGGNSWIILDKERFATEILPSFFKQSQFTSFTRKLSRWKFQRVSRGPYIGAYHHQYFKKDKKYLCLLMSCNAEPPTLAVVAKVRQLAIADGDYSEAALVATELPEYQKSALKSLEEMNKMLIKEKINKIRMQKAQLAERNKEILMNEKARIVQNIQLQVQQTRQNQLIRSIVQAAPSTNIGGAMEFAPHSQASLVPFACNVLQQNAHQSLKQNSNGLSQIRYIPNLVNTVPQHQTLLRAKLPYFSNNIYTRFHASAA